MTKLTISLRVFHPSIDPREITAELGLPPYGSGKAGEPRTTPKGRPLSGINRLSFWRTHLAGDESGGADLRSALRDIAARLMPYEFFIQRMRSEEGRVELDVGWFLDGNEGLTLDHELLNSFAALGIDLAFDLYPPDVEGDEDSRTQG